MKRKYLYKDVESYVNTEVEVEIEFDDLLELIESCNEEELKIIRDLVELDTKDVSVNNLYDEQKFQLLLAAMKKYNLEQLQEKLGIKNYEY